MKDLDEAFNFIEKDRALAKVHLDKQAIIVRALDRKIEALEAQKERLEKEKQAELSKMEAYMELAVINTHALPDGYTVTYDHKRKLEVKDAGEFLRWLKSHCTPSEVLSFFEGAIKSASLKKFVEKKHDEARSNGIMDLKIDGLNIGEITFRRLTTFTKGKENGR